MGEPIDFEIEAHLFRLMRSGRFQRAEPLLKQAQEDFPDVAPERLRACARELAERLLKDH
jgi:hypothetical protein